MRNALPTERAPGSLLRTAPPGHMMLHFASGRTSAFTVNMEQRNGSLSTSSFYLYVPSDHPVSRRARKLHDATRVVRRWPLVVLVHGSRRDAQGLRDMWAEWAELHSVVLLCPLFPAELDVSVHGSTTCSASLIVVARWCTQLQARRVRQQTIRFGTPRYRRLRRGGVGTYSYGAVLLVWLFRGSAICA